MAIKNTTQWFVFFLFYIFCCRNFFNFYVTGFVCYKVLNRYGKLKPHNFTHFYHKESLFSFLIKVFSYWTSFSSGTYCNLLKSIFLIKWGVTWMQHLIKFMAKCNIRINQRQKKTYIVFKISEDIKKKWKYTTFNLFLFSPLYTSGMSSFYLLNNKHRSRVQVSE